jgi:hypothetical protein
MSYVFDNSPLSVMFRNYYRKPFKKLWELFDELTADEKVLSTREVLREIEDGPLENLREWALANRTIFATPTAAEGTFVGQIYAIPHFQQNIERKKIHKGGNIADPFIIARAAVTGSAVVTMELHKPNGAKIPNICEHFDVKCLSLEEFMEEEGWEFG